MRTGLSVMAVLAVCALAAAGGAKVRRLEARQIAAMQEAGAKVVFLDARKGDSSNKIADSIHLPPDDVDRWAATADPKALYIAYCT